MITYYFVFLFLSLLFAGINYLVTINLLTTVVVFALSIVYFFFVAMMKIRKNKNRTKKFKQCYTFINSFIIALSIKENITSAYEITIQSMDESFVEDLKDIDNLGCLEKIKYLDRYFEFEIYGLFVSIVDIYLERGGDILKMSKYMIDELRNDYNYLISIETLKTRKYGEFISLWFFSILILIILRFTLNDFYIKIQGQYFFYIGVAFLFAFILFSIDYLLTRSLKVDIKGWHHEKH